MMDEEVHFGFAEQVEAARDGWLQGRYYSEDGDTVADFLSFRNVFEINPFVVGVSYARERRVYAQSRDQRLSVTRSPYDKHVISERPAT